MTFSRKMQSVEFLGGQEALRHSCVFVTELMIYHRPYLDVACGQWVTTNMGNIEMWEILFRIVGHSSSLGCTLRFSVWFESEQSEDSGKIQYVTIKTCLELPWSEKCFIVIVEQKKIMMYYIILFLKYHILSRGSVKIASRALRSMFVCSKSFFHSNWINSSFPVPGTSKTSGGTVCREMVQTRKHAECEQWCNRLKTIQGLPYWCEQRTAGDGSNKLYRIWGVEIQNERRCWEWNFETLPQYGLWLTAGAGAANLCQRDTRCRCQVLGTESLLLSSRWSLCAVKCHSKESDRAAPYAFWNCHPNLFPVLWNQARTYKNNQNTQLVATDSILISTRSFIILIFSLILTSLFSRNT